MNSQANSKNTSVTKGDLTIGGVLHHLVRLSAPMTWGILMVVGFQLVDTYFVSLLGDEALTAFTFTFPVTYFIFALVMGFSIAASSVLSRLIGEGDQDVVKRIMAHSLIISAIAAAILSLIGGMTQETLFGVLGATPDMIPPIMDYMNIWLWGVVFVSVPMVANSGMRAAGDALTPAIIMTVSMVVNIVLDPILILGLWGFPRLEMQGAAIATLLANVTAFVFGLFILIYKKRILTFKSLLCMRHFVDSTKRILTIALPVGLTNTIQPAINALIIALLAKASTDAVAAFGIVSRIEAFAFVILMGVSVGMGPIIGQNFGAGQYERVRETVTRAIQFNIIWSFFIALVLALLARPLAGMFTEDEAIIEAMVMFCLIVPVSYAFGNVINGWASVFNAMGMPKRAFVMIVVKYVVLLIPALYIGYYVDGARGIFVAISVVNVTSGIIFHLLNWKCFTQKCPHEA